MSTYHWTSFFLLITLVIFGNACTLLEHRAHSEPYVFSNTLLNARIQAVEFHHIQALSHRRHSYVSLGKKKVPKFDAAHASLQYILDIYLINGMDLKSKLKVQTVDALYRYVYTQGKLYFDLKPAVGDLVFFNNTYDRNRDGLWNDTLTLVGIVHAVDRDQTVHVWVYRDQKLQSIPLNLEHPDEPGDFRRPQNILLRRERGPHQLYPYSGRLFAGFADLLGNRKSVRFIPRWKPQNSEQWLAEDKEEHFSLRSSEKNKF